MKSGTCALIALIYNNIRSSRASTGPRAGNELVRATIISHAAHNLSIGDGNRAHHAAGEARAAPERHGRVREAQHNREQGVKLYELAIGQRKALGANRVRERHFVLRASRDHCLDNAWPESR